MPRRRPPQPRQNPPRPNRPQQRSQVNRPVNLNRLDIGLVNEAIRNINQQNQAPPTPPKKILIFCDRNRAANLTARWKNGLESELNATFVFRSLNPHGESIIAAIRKVDIIIIIIDFCGIEFEENGQVFLSQEYFNELKAASLQA